MTCSVIIKHDFSFFLKMFGTISLATYATKAIITDMMNFQSNMLMLSAMNESVTHSHCALLAFLQP